MELEKTTFATDKTAVATCERLYPAASDFTLIEHGYDNLVVLVDEQYAIRFPRNESAYTRSQYEKQILDGLASIDIVTIPHVIGAGDNPPYVITSFVPGRHISSSEVEQLDARLQDDFAKKVAEFAYAMHSSLSLAKAEAVRKELRLDEEEDYPWDVYFTNRLLEYDLPNHTQNTIAKVYYEKWKNLHTSTPIVIVHDDLHTENMLFDEGYQLTGILDFGDTNTGTPEQELRQLFRISEHVLRVAIKKYEELSGETLSYEAAKTWSIMQELAVYSKQITANNTSHPSFKRASDNLNKWLGKGNWGEGYNLAPNARL